MFLYRVSLGIRKYELTLLRRQGWGILRLISTRNKRGAQSCVMGHKACGQWACVRYVFCWIKTIHLHYFCSVAWFKLNGKFNRQNNSYQANVKKCKKKNTITQLQFWTDVKIQWKVASIKTRDYHTQNNALRKKLTQLTLSQHASDYEQTL